MASNVFISFDHDDSNQVGGLKSLKSKSSFPLDFHDHSLKEPVTNRFGNPIKYPPSDARSKPVRDEIIKKFGSCSKLVVLIGVDTKDSEWVEWEINTFHKMKEKISGENTWKRIRGMRLKGAEDAETPGALGGQSTQVLDWDPDALDTWLDLDADK